MATNDNPRVAPAYPNESTRARHTCARARVGATRLAERFPSKCARDAVSAIIVSTELWLAACVVFATASCSETASGVKAQGLARTLEVEGGTVSLGHELPLSLSAQGSGESQRLIRPLTGSGISRIVVTADSSRRVVSILADYATSVSYDSLIAAERLKYGRGMSGENARPGQVPSRSVTWRDSLTELRLFEDRNRNAWTVRRIMRSVSGRP